MSHVLGQREDPWRNDDEEAQRLVDAIHDSTAWAEGQEESPERAIYEALVYRKNPWQHVIRMLRESGADEEWVQKIDVLVGEK